MKTIALLVFLVTGLQPVWAQVKPEQAVAEAMHRLLATYSRPQQLSFVVDYKYAAEEKPAVYLDSMHGEVKLQGSKSWYNLALTEYVLNDDYQIMLFKEDQLIYLVKPSKTHFSALDLHGMGPKSLATFDSLIAHDKDISCSYSGNATEEYIEIVFARHPVYRKITWNIDRSTGYIKKIISLVKAGLLYDPSIQSQVDDKDTYAIVEACFSNYREGQVDETLFNSKRYFTKEGQEYKPTAQYSSYKIFLGSPGL